MKNILFLFALLLLVGCAENEDPLLDKIKAAAEASEKSKAGYEQISLAELTDFEWDTLYHFHQLDDKNYISRQMGFKWDGEGVPNLHRRLLFVRGGKVVKYIDYDFRELPLTVYGCGDDRWVYPRNRTNFAAFKYCTGEVKGISLIPMACIGDFQEMVAAECLADEPAA